MGNEKQTPGRFGRAVDRLEGRPLVKLMVLVATVIGVPGSILAVLAIVDGGEPAVSAPPQRDRADRIAECQERHDLDRVTVWKDAEDGSDSSVIASCSWPAKPWTEPDGYAELTFLQTPGPGEFEATNATVQDHLRQDNCSRFKTIYEVTQTGANQLETNEVPAGSVVTPSTDTPAMETFENPYPDGVIVQHMTGMHLKTAACVG